MPIGGFTALCGDNFQNVKINVIPKSLKVEQKLSTNAVAICMCIFVVKTRQCDLINL